MDPRFRIRKDRPGDICPWLLSMRDRDTGTELPINEFFDGEEALEDFNRRAHELLATPKEEWVKLLEQVQESRA